MPVIPSKPRKDLNGAKVESTFDMDSFSICVSLPIQYSRQPKFALT
jgi:hypothetical protein